MLIDHFKMQNHLAMRCSKPIVLLLVSLVWSINGMCQISKIIQGDGHVTTNSKIIAPFTEVWVEDGWELLLSQGNHYEIRVEADSNFQPHLQIIEENGALKIHSDAYLKKGSHSKQTIHLTFKELSLLTGEDCAHITFMTPCKIPHLELNLSDGAKLEALGLSVAQFKGHFEDGSVAKLEMNATQSMDIWATDGSDLKFDHLDADTCQLHIDDGATASFSGSVNCLKIRASDKGKTNAPNLVVKNAFISLSESSMARVQVEETLMIELFEKSSLTYTGDPEIIRRNVCPSCALTLKN